MAAASSYAVSINLPKVYEGTAKLLVTPGQSAGPANYNDLLTGERLTRTYTEVMRTRPVVEAAALQAGVAKPYEQAVKLIDVKPLRDTQLIQISTRANNPEEAARFANQLAAVFVQQTQTNQSSRFAASKEALGRQVEQLAADIAQRSRQIDTLRAPAPSAERDADIARLQGELTQLQQSYATAVRSFEEVRVAEARSTDLLSVVEPAFPPSAPVQPKVRLNVALAAVVGLLLAAGAAFLLEYLDDRLLSTDRLQRFTSLLPLGTVAMMGKDDPSLPATRATVSSNGHVNGQANGKAVSNGHYYSASPAAEAFRLLRASLQFASVERPLRRLLVTSSEAGDGKSTTAANLAAVMAQAGQNVILVDADLRRPTQHEIFGVANQGGLTSLLVQERPARELLVETGIAGLSLLPSGPIPPNPSELLASARMRSRLAELSEHADIVILDAPPVLPVSDPAVLASQVDGTLLVVNAQKTRGGQANHAIDTLRKAGGHILGAVLNRVPEKKAGYGGYYAAKQYEPKVAVAANQ